MFFGKKKKNREGVLDDDQIKAVIETLSVNDGATVERINWDGTTSVVSGRVSHVGNNFDDFILVEEGSGEGIHFRIKDGDISKIQRVAISIDLDETHVESFMPEESILEILEALDHGDVVNVSFYNPLKGKGDSVVGAITLKDEYNKIFAVEFEENGELVEKTFDLNQDRIIDIIIL
jgi:hypothetical protein